MSLPFPLSDKEAVRRNLWKVLWELLEVLNYAKELTEALGDELIRIRQERDAPVRKDD